jgi:cobalt-zinc-cadmium efflux system protein
MVDRHRFYPAPATFASRRSRIVSSDHHTHSHAREIVAADQKRLKIVLAAVTIYCATEFVGGYFSNSLALMTDAVHMLTDIAALGLGLLTLWISTRPATGGKTFGYLRAEILGALLNGIFLWLLVAFIWIEAAHRLHNPATVDALPVMGIAVVGFMVNIFSAWMTYDPQEGGRAGMAIRAAFLHAVSDLIGVGGVFISGAVIYFTGWSAADSIISFIIGALVLYGSWGLIKEGMDILMESVPSHIDLGQLREDLLAVEGTAEVHDLHVWCLTSREVALAAHAVVAADADQDRVLSDMHQILEAKFNIRHMTVQLERDSRRHREPEHF